MRWKRDNTAAREILTRGAHAVDPAYPRKTSRAEETRVDMSLHTLLRWLEELPTRETRYLRLSEEEEDLDCWRIDCKVPNAGNELTSFYISAQSMVT